MTGGVVLALLRDLLRVPQPQEHRPAAARRALRPPARGHRPQRVRRPRPGRGPARPARHRHLRRVPVGHLRLFFVFVPISIALALVSRATRAPGCSSSPRSRSTGCWRRELLPAAVARARLRAAGRLRRSADDRRQPAAGRRCSTSASSSCATRRPPAPRRASPRSRRCTCRSSSPRRSRPTCSAPRGRARSALWVLLALTVLATLYFGWHYVLDDVAGMLIAVTLARAREWADRLRARATARRRVRAPQPSPA